MMQYQARLFCSGLTNGSVWQIFRLLSICSDFGMNAKVICMPPIIRSKIDQDGQTAQWIFVIALYSSWYELDCKVKVTLETYCILIEVSSLSY